MDESAQERYLDAEEVALKTTIGNLEQMLDGVRPEQGFIRTFDIGFSLGFMTAQAMHAQGFDITEVQTAETNLPI